MTVARSNLSVSVFVLLLGLGGSARAELQLPLQNFRPAPSPLDYLVTESGRTLPHLHPAAALLMNYSHRPLDLFDLSKDERLGEVVKYRVNLDLLLALGLWDFFELGVALPATLAQGSEQLPTTRTQIGELSAALGDIRVVPKAMIRSKFGASFAVAVPFSVPTGAREQLLGDEFLTLAPRLIFSMEGRNVGAALNAGVLVRRDQDVKFTETQTLKVDEEVFWSVGLKLPLWTGKLELLVDGFFSLSLYEQNLQQFPVEVLGGFRVFFPYGFIGNFGGGAGVTRGVGAPRFRVYWGLGYQYERAAPASPRAPSPVPAPAAGPADPDNDGILGPADDCPNQPEDKDGFQDADGCPDPDNDKDGVPDADDKCPEVPEDRDGFEDADGCPDVDNDNDGIPDRQDRCPMKAEDVDQFEDADGCPEPDNDKDGVPDQADRCPLTPEDRDGFADDDGCPDPDNDNDRVLDVHDKCPNEPEVYNGVDDSDGCPDRSRGPVQIQRGKITVPPVYFATNREVILARSFPVLRLVASTLRDNPWIKRVRIEGHTDSRGGDASNLELSDRRATSVRVFLVQNGVDPARLESKGYGETRPIASNSTRQGRAANRRVEFVIVDPPMPAGP